MLFQEALRLELHLYDSVVQQRLIRNMRFLRLGEGKSDQELYRQALRMELHMGDEVVKRRLIQVMEQLLTVRNGISEPAEEEISAAVSRKVPLSCAGPPATVLNMYF